MRRFHGVISADYELVPQTVLRYFELEDELARRIALQYASPTVVDVGLGTGITTKAILARNPGALVKGVDNEPAMLKQARANMRDEISLGTVEVYERDAAEYLRSLPRSSVDVVASSYTLHNCLAAYRTMLHAEVLRVLRPGGMFINNDKYASDDHGEYVRELVDQIERYEVLSRVGRDDLRRIWVVHEIEDQLPERIMWTEQTLDELRLVGFTNGALQERVAQYAIMAAYKPA